MKLSLAYAGCLLAGLGLSSQAVPVPDYSIEAIRFGTIPALLEYYTGAAWQPGRRKGGIDVEDLVHLVRRNAAGTLRLVDGDDRKLLPGIRVYTGARHTYASQYVRVAGDPPFVLASDNCYLYRNIESRSPVATFEVADRAANLPAFDRMLALAGAKERVLPGHDPLQFERFPSTGGWRRSGSVDHGNRASGKPASGWPERTSRLDHGAGDAVITVMASMNFRSVPT